jgi:hypothetical protein
MGHRRPDEAQPAHGAARRAAKLAGRARFVHPGAGCTMVTWRTSVRSMTIPAMLTQRA